MVAVPGPGSVPSRSDPAMARVNSGFPSLDAKTRSVSKVVPTVWARLLPVRFISHHASALLGSVVAQASTNAGLSR